MPLRTFPSRIVGFFGSHVIGGKKGLADLRFYRPSLLIILVFRLKKGMLYPCPR